MADDFTNNTSTVGTVAVGGSTTGNIEMSDDTDWFAVDLVEGRTYRFDLEGAWTLAGTLWDPFLRGLYDSNGNIVSGTADDDGGTSLNSQVTFTPTENGTYFVSASSYGSGTGTYRLSVTVADDFAAGTNTPGRVAVGSSARGEIETDTDRDWFAVDLVEGRTYRFDLEGAWTLAGTLWDPFLRGLYDSNGNIVSGTADDDGGTSLNSQVTFTPTENGTYFVSASSYGSGTGAYRLSVTVTDDFAAGTNTPGRVAVGSSAWGEIETDTDRDWFAVELEAGKVYRFDLEGSATKSGTMYDPVIYGVHDSNGDKVAGTFADGGGTGHNARLVFAPTASGTYYVDAGAWAGSGQQGTYKLTVTGDDFAASTGTTGRVAVGSPASGGVDFSNDRDWFAVDLVGGKTYRIDLEGSGNYALSKLTLWDPVIHGIFDSDGDLIGNSGNDDLEGGGNNKDSRKIFTPGESGTYYVSAGSWVNQLGTYRLSVWGDDLAADTSTTGTVTVGGSATGRIDYTGGPEKGDADWFAVELVAGRTYGFEQEGSPSEGGPSLRWPYIRGIYDSDGHLIAGTTDDDVGTDRISRVAFTPEESGTFYVSASYSGVAWQSSDDHMGSYTVSVEEGL